MRAKSIAVAVDQLFQDSDVAEPTAFFRKAGYFPVHLGIEPGATLRGLDGERSLSVDAAFRGASTVHYDALLIPGGYAPALLRADDQAVRFAGDFVRSGKPVFAVRHGMQLLISAGVVRGRRLAGCRSIAHDILNAGADFVAQAVVEDGNLVTCRSRADLPAFSMACLSSLNRRDSRSEPRYGIRTPVTYNRFASRATPSLWADAMNCSDSGMCFQSRQPLKPPQVIVVRSGPHPGGVTEPHGQPVPAPKAMALAEVRWCRGSDRPGEGFTVGVRYI